MKVSYTFKVRHPFPKRPPHDHGRWGRPFVPDDVKAWRAAIVKAYRKMHPLRPAKNARPVVWYYFFSKNTKMADTDSLVHAAQDAVSKDAWEMHDKGWNHRGTAYVGPYFTKDCLYVVMIYDAE